MNDTIKGDNMPRISFKGILTPELRRIIGERRRDMGLSYCSLGNFFGVDWSTVRKWEKGPTVLCSIAHRPMVESFINGEYDDMLMRMQNDYYRNNDSRFIPATMQVCMDRIGSTYAMCEEFPELKSQLITELMNCTSQTLSQLIMPTDAVAVKRHAKERSES